MAQQSADLQTNAESQHDHSWRNAVLDGPFVDKTDLYRMPWTNHDNPIGWLEITDECDLGCKGCYRKQLEGHKPLAQLREEIDFFIKHRNTDSIVLAGGEPTMHPEVLDVIAYTTEKGLKPHLTTGGQRLLDLPFVKEMKKAGLEGMGVHVDAKQGRPGWAGKTEIELNELREQMADTVAEAGGMNCGFGVTVFRDTLEHVPALVRWTIDNRHRVSGFSFITYRGLTILPGYQYGVDGSPVNVKKEDIGYATKEEQAAITVTSYDVLEKIREEVPEYDPCAYLGGTKSHQSVKWLLGQLVATDKTILGSVGKKTIELGQIVHHLTKGRYFIYSRGQYFPRMALFAGIFDPKVRKMWKRYLLNPTLFFKRLYGVGFGIVQAPDVLSDGSIDMCDSCPDMTVYEGQLINSCRMDEYRKYGGLLSPMHGEAEA